MVRHATDDRILHLVPGKITSGNVEDRRSNSLDISSSILYIRKRSEEVKLNVVNSGIKTVFPDVVTHLG